MSRRRSLSARRVLTLGKITELDNESPLTPPTPVAVITRDLELSRLSDDENNAATANTPLGSLQLSWPLLRDMDISKDIDNDWSKTDYDGDNTGLFRNAFKIKGTPENAVKEQQKRQLRSSSSEISSFIKRPRRLVGMALAAGAMITSPSKSGATSSSSISTSSSSHENEGSPAIAQNLTPYKPGGIFKLTKARLPLEECDPNSQDSGYSGSLSFGEEKPHQLLELHSKPKFQFAEPLAVAPRKFSLDARSPMKSPLRASPQQTRKQPAIFHSVSSGYESTDDGFNDLIDMESLDNDCSSLPNGLSSLISGNIVADTSRMCISTTPEATPSATTGGRSRLAVRRSLSLQIDSASSPSADNERSPGPAASRVRSCLFRSPTASCSTAKLCFTDESPRARPELGVISPPPVSGRKFKRPEPPTDHSPVLVKRSRKSTSFQDVPTSNLQTAGVLPQPSPVVLQRSFSETEAHVHIKRAIGRSTTENDLTGDFSKPCILPLAEGRHEDLKSISVETLSRLVDGEFADMVSDYKIVDCRYPYEYEAGHIKGALNLYTKEMIEEFLLKPLEHAAPSIESDVSRKRSILVFHCEFSWERGPNMSRFLRNIDRQLNKEHYPALHYPEIYLLHGGYQRFYKEMKSMCTPQDYRPMRHPDHEADLKQFRSKTKSWQSEKTGRPNVVTARANLKRLGF
ncbi:M-phase inducer phosphatase-like isoform X2 [Copidosoma floridanum]|uniref:M-phase inducer phosphatase-like isoform X2 n=1 Tax=Copidosoma floridanum TaxID=29053 RepID=UPI000C6F5318|nr:M-phase inducer phosphatase-like isoform X2 [Copidosoma floridanum]